MQFTEISILIRLSLGALATFFAIIVWSRTRNPSWILIVVGILLYYVNIVFETLEKFGIISDRIFYIGNLPVIKTLIVNLPILFFIIGLIVFIARKKI